MFRQKNADIFYMVIAIRQFYETDCPVYGGYRDSRNAIKVLFRRELVDYG